MANNVVNVDAILDVSLNIELRVIETRNLNILLEFWSNAIKFYRQKSNRFEEHDECVYMDPDHGAMASFVSAIWDSNYIRIGDYECDMVVDLNVRIGNLLNTRENYISRPQFLARPICDVRQREYIQPTNVRRSQRIRNRNRRPPPQIVATNEQNPSQLGGQGAEEPPYAPQGIEGHGLLPNPLSQQTD